MKHILKLIAFVLVCALMTSCQKPLDETPSPPLPVDVTHDSVTTISKLIFIDYRSSDSDTLGYIEFNYDDRSRITQINNTSDEVTTFYYTGSDTIAYKKIIIDNDPVYGYEETHFYFYDNLKRLVKDSVLYDSELDGVHEYTYSNNMIMAVFTYEDDTNPGITRSNFDTAFIGNTGNVIKTTSLYYTEPYVISTFTYDNQINPFYQLNIHSTYYPVPNSNFFIEDFYLQKNNMVSSSYDYPGLPGGAQNDSYAYTYNTSGLPDTVTITYENVPQDDIRILFRYKKI